MSSATPQTGQRSLRNVLRWLPGVLITILALYLLGRSIQWQTFLAYLASVPLATLLLTTVIYLVAMVVRALAWQFLLQRKVAASAVILALNEGYFFNNILPFRMGELARAFLLGRRSRLGIFHVLPTIVVERSYDLVIAASLLLITLPMALQLEWARPVATVMLLVIFAGLVGIFFAARNRAWVEARAETWASRSEVIRRWVLPQLHAVLNGFSVLTRVEYFAASFGLLLLCWLMGILRDWIIIRVFVPDAPLWWAALGISASNIFGAIPSVMASLGTYELGAVGALTLVGMTKESVFAYALIVHVTHLVFSSIIGAFAVSREGETIADLVSEIRRAR